MPLAGVRQNMLTTITVDLTNITAIAGFFFGLIGASLGIFNTFQQWRKDKVRLRLVPKIYRNVDGAGRLCSARIPTETQITWNGFCFEIVNLSVFSITINEIGIVWTEKDSRVVFDKPEINNNGSLPKKLEARESLICYIPSKSPYTIFTEGLPFAKCFYATTSCGVTVTGNSAVSQFLIKIGKKYKSTP